ncbi:RNA-dependent DNA polymerase [Sedimentibacter sp. SX930]|nr:RNA-dependent DNA polymerase [Sedimentibacter sp. SX930]
MLDKLKYPTKKYLHFDNRVRIENAESYVTNPSKIAQHSFLPLIHYTSSFEKNIGEKNPEFDNRPIKPKNRDIMYAGHWDNYIYKYYAEMLNSDYYNELCLKLGIDECITAYRNNKPKKSNIDFAAEIINKIVEYDEAYVVVGDFTNYFDKIDHILLKDALKRVMNKSRLSDDWFNVFHSITKYGYYEKELLIEMFGSDESLKFQKKNSYFKQLGDFREFQRKNRTERNKEKFGIPQGTAISAVFANVYALSFDIELNEIANNYSGLYRRYSDDFILVIPKSEIANDLDMRGIEGYIRDLAKKNKIVIQENKTGLYLYKNQEVINIDNPKIRRLDYLGFIFDGKTVRMRGKSPYKFYRKAKQMIGYSQARKRTRQLPKLPYRKRIYSLYTDLGTKSTEFGNFISYAKRAQKKFDEISPNTTNLMMTQIKNRKKKIEKMMGIKIHTKYEYLK